MNALRWFRRRPRTAEAAVSQPPDAPAPAVPAPLAPMPAPTPTPAPKPLNRSEVMQPAVKRAAAQIPVRGSDSRWRAAAYCCDACDELTDRIGRDPSARAEAAELLSRTAGGRMCVGEVTP